MKPNQKKPWGQNVSGWDVSGWIQAWSARFMLKMSACTSDGGCWWNSYQVNINLGFNEHWWIDSTLMQVICIISTAHRGVYKMNQAA